MPLFLATVAALSPQPSVLLLAPIAGNSSVAANAGRRNAEIRWLSHGSGLATQILHHPQLTPAIHPDVPDRCELGCPACFSSDDSSASTLLTLGSAEESLARAFAALQRLQAAQQPSTYSLAEETASVECTVVRGDSHATLPMHCSGAQAARPSPRCTAPSAAGKVDSSSRRTSDNEHYRSGAIKSSIWTKAVAARAARLRRQQEAGARSEVAAFLQSLTKARHRYQRQSQGLRLLPDIPAVKHYTKHDNVDWPHDDILILTGASQRDLAQLCQETEECLAFSSTGHLKKAAPASDRWKPAPGVFLSIVNNVDPCAAGLHRCVAHSHCVRRDDVNFNCLCLPGYAGDGMTSCVPVAALPTLAVTDFAKQPTAVVRLDLGPLDGWDSRTFRASVPFIFIEGRDSPMNDLILVSALPDTLADRVQQLQQLCRRHPRCIAFNTNGMLKSQLQSPKRWQVFSTIPGEGMYVMDINHCEYAGEGCPDGAECRKLGAAEFECRCKLDGSLPVDMNTDRPLDPPEWLCPEVKGHTERGRDGFLRNQGEHHDTGVVEELGVKGNTVIVFAVDELQWVGLAAAIRWVAGNAVTGQMQHAIILSDLFSASSHSWN